MSQPAQCNIKPYKIIPDECHSSQKKPQLVIYENSTPKTVIKQNLSSQIEISSL